MAAFHFEACDRSGGRQQGLMDADSLSAASSSLRERGWIVISVRAETVVQQTLLPEPNWNPMTWLPPGKLDVELGLQQIATMLRSGMTLLSALKTTAEQSRRPSMAKIWMDVSKQIQEGGSFADALSRYRRYFPDYVVQLVKVGEASGTLDVVLTRAAEQMERARAMRFMLMHAMLYPLIVLVLAIAVTMYMLIVLIPKLQKFLTSRNKKLPEITQALLDFSQWMQTYLPHVTVGVALLILLFSAFRAWPPGRLFSDRIFLKIPIIGGILRTSATASFSRTLGLLLESGITLVAGLAVVKDLMGNKAVSKHVEEVRESVMSGGTLGAALLQKRMFMPMLGRMASVGEETGTLDTVLAETATFHEKQLASAVKWLSVMVEPAIILVVGGIVGFVYIAFFLALYSMAS